MKEQTAPLHVAILAFSAKSYGGDSYFRSILPALERYGDGAEFLVLVRDDHYREVKDNGRVRLMKMRVPAFGVGRILWEQIVLPNLLKNMKVDVVYTANNVGLFWPTVPCVIAIRNMEPLSKTSEGMPLLLLLRRFLLRMLTRMSLHRASRIVAVSHFVKNALLSLGTDAAKIDVIYHGVDDLETAPAELSDKMAGTEEYVASASKFVRYANLTTLIRAYAKMRELGFKGKLRFAGGSYDPGYEREVRSLVRDMSLEAHVNFMGYIPRAHLQVLMRGCRAFLFPSMLEACPFTLLEAMRQGAPIVATTAEPMREFCGDAAVYVEPMDSNTFGNAAYELATRADIRESLATKAKARASQFRWEHSVRQLVESLRMAVDGSNSQQG